MNELQTISTVSLGSDLNDQFHRNPIGQIRESKLESFVIFVCIDLRGN